MLFIIDILIKPPFFPPSLFCKLASLLRQRLAAFGPDVRIAVRCLQVLVKGIDAK